MESVAVEESGICIGTAFQGKGYGKETVALLLELAYFFNDLFMHSQRVYEFKEFLYILISGHFRREEAGKGMYSPVNAGIVQSVKTVLRKWNFRIGIYRKKSIHFSRSQGNIHIKAHHLDTLV